MSPSDDKGAHAVTDAPDRDKPQIEIVTDEDWKEQVKAADARLDAEREAQQASATESQFDPTAMPPASFATLVQMFSTQAIVSMGLIPTPEGEVLRQLPLARHFIDMLSVLEDKCRGNLSPQEQQLLDMTLHELRMAYVEISKETPSA